MECEAASDVSRMCKCKQLWLQAAGLNVTSVLLYKLDYGPTDTPASSAAAPAPLAAVPIPASASHGLPGNTIAGARLAPAAKVAFVVLDCCAGRLLCPSLRSAGHGLPGNTIASARPAPAAEATCFP